MDTTLAITLHHDPDGRTVLALRGEVDIVTAAHLRTALTKQLHCGTGLVLDVAGAVLIDAAGLRVLTAAQRQAAENGKPPITLRGVRPLFAKTLHLTGLEHLFPREPALEPVLAHRAPAAPLPSLSAGRTPRPDRRAASLRAREDEPAEADHELAAV